MTGALVGPDAREAGTVRPLAFRHRRPPWLRARAPWGGAFGQVAHLVRDGQLHTVCQEARCPNIGECWGSGTATFLILGDVCTRGCRFCAVTSGRPGALDETEPDRLADAVAQLGVRHAVITSVTRDDLPDGGAGVFARCIQRLRRKATPCSVEVLVPDFAGRADSLRTVMAQCPDILNHNLETVPRLYREVRPKADYGRSLALLADAKRLWPGAITKSGIMVGLGERLDEIEAVMRDLAGADVDILTIGQYLRPSEEHIPIDRYYTPEEFAALRDSGLTTGLRWVESGPLVRSSYGAERQLAALRGASGATA